MAKTTAQLIADIDAQLDLCIANPGMDFREGDLSVSASQKVEQLLKMRAALVNQGGASLAVIEFEDTVGQFGERL